MNDYLVTKLKEGRLGKGLKQSDVTKLIGIKNTTLSNYENGNTEPDIDTFLQLCELYELDYAAILGEAYGLSVSGLDFDIKPSEIEIIKKYRSLDSFGQETVNITIARESDRSEQIAGLESRIGTSSACSRIYPYLHKIAAAGVGFYFDDIPTDTLDAPFREDADFIIGVSGDSMEPTYYDGDLVYVQKRQVVEPGEIGIFIVNGECYIKEAGEKELISHNPKYNPISGNNEINYVGKVLGKVEKK